MSHNTKIDILDGLWTLVGQKVPQPPVKSSPHLKFDLDVHNYVLQKSTSVPSPNMKSAPFSHIYTFCTLTCSF